MMESNEKNKKSASLMLTFYFSCGGSTRTNDLQVMSLASYQLLHSAIMRVQNYTFFIISKKK